METPVYVDGTTVFGDGTSEHPLNTAGSTGATFAAPIKVTGLTIYANNAAALAGGLVAGNLYRTGADPDTVCVVH